MRKALLFIFLLNFTNISVNAQLTNGLVAHWNFNGNANDVTTNGHNGVVTNVTYTTGKNGAANSAAYFNGTSAYISVPHQNDLNVTNYTICAIVKPMGFYSGTCQGNFIMHRGSEGYSGAYGIGYFDNAYNSCSVLDTNLHVFYGQAGNTVGSPTNLQSSTKVHTNTWYCVSVTFSGDTIRIYVNGALTTTYPLFSGSIGSSSDSIGIGKYLNGGSAYPYWYNGIIDDLRLYNRVLTPSEISSFCGLFDTAIAIKDSIAKKNICMDDTFHLSYTVTNQFTSGNVFTAQLSDASGNFTTPVNIGTVTSSIDGSIVCNVPSGLTPGNGYRVRIVSTNPVRTSDITSPIGIYTTLLPTVSISATPSGPYAPSQYITFASIPVDAGVAPIFQWYRNGNPIPGANNDSLYINTLNDGDSIYIVVTSSNPCPPDLTAQSNKIGVNINSSVNDIQLPNLSLYPNPNNGSFTVSANSILVSEVLLEVINPLGQVITYKRASVSDNTLNERIETGQISSGIYLLRISADGKQRNIRLTVMN